MAILESISAALATTETAKMTAVEAVKQQIAEKLGTSATEGLKADEHVLRQAAQVENFRVGELPNDIFDKETSEIAEAEVRNSLAEKLGENPSLESAEMTTLEKVQSPDVRPLVETNELAHLKECYIEDLKNRSEFPDTIDVQEFHERDFRKASVDEVREKRLEFSEMKGDLRKEWEEINKLDWPRYQEDVYHNNKCYRRAGDAYDAHHIHPLGLGGENSARNLTPTHVLDHSDKWGIHAPDSFYAKLEKYLGGL